MKGIVIKSMQIAKIYLLKVFNLILRKLSSLKVINPKKRPIKDDNNSILSIALNLTYHKGSFNICK
jgi:hypothetical protein